MQQDGTRSDAVSKSELIFDLAKLARRDGRLAIDTEFVSEGRYRPLLCLVQVALAPRGGSRGARIELLDPLRNGFDPGPLAEVLADPNVEVVFHAGAQDVAILKREWRVQPRNLFDTQVAAGFAGLGAQTGYGTLLSRVLGTQLSKSAGFTRWDARPLTAEQLDYARSDVEELLALSDTLESRLDASGRLHWAREECRRLEDVSDERTPDEAYRRLPRVSQLRPRARAVARALAEWRELTARSENRPVGSILSDVALVEIARRQPRSVQQLQGIRGVRPDLGRRRGAAVLDVVAAGAEADAPPVESWSRDGPDPNDAPRIALCEALLRQRVSEAGLAYELVASRADITEIVRAVREGGEPSGVRTLEGWRRELVGAELLDLLAGRLKLSTQPAGGVRVEREG
ncbi:MAG: ribonuclease D [Actinobacteria bacterium]|nr:ribonuclease D [Actinomycetota bacterium]